MATKVTLTLLSMLIILGTYTFNQLKTIQDLRYELKVCKISLDAAQFRIDVDEIVNGWSDTKLDDWLRKQGIIKDGPLRSTPGTNNPGE